MCRCCASRFRRACSPRRSSTRWRSVGEQFSRGFGHITTRQNIQFHFVKLHDVETAMRMLADAGLTTREACGNSVRNITCCPQAGVSPTELFDVTPYSEAMTRYLLRHPLSSSLPRKFKIAFEGCTDEDHALLGMHDLGYRAAISDGRRGFRVVVGGGTSIMVKSAEPVHEFLPAGEIFNVAEAVIRVFHEFGDYKHKQANRLKFLDQVARLGRLPRGVPQEARGVQGARRRLAAVRSRQSAGRGGAGLAPVALTLRRRSSRRSRARRARR